MSIKYTNYSNIGGTGTTMTASNRIPPGMGELATKPLEYVRQLERRAPSIDGSTLNHDQNVRYHPFLNEVEIMHEVNQIYRIQTKNKLAIMVQ